MRNGHKMTVAAEFRGSDALGLPSTTDRDKFIAFLKIAQEDKARNGLITNPIRFSGYRMIRELGLSRHGDIYDDIMRWGKRMTDTTITSEQVVYLAFRKVYSDEVLHVFRRFSRSGSSAMNDADRLESFEVVLEDWLLDNLNERYVIPEDFNTYKLLKRATAKGIFGYLHVWFHASTCRPVEKDYVDLCNLLNIQSYKHCRRLRRQWAARWRNLSRSATCLNGTFSLCFPSRATNWCFRSATNFLDFYGGMAKRKFSIKAQRRRKPLH